MTKHVAVCLTEQWLEDRQRVVINVAFDIGNVGSRSLL